MLTLAAFVLWKIPVDEAVFCDSGINAVNNRCTVGQRWEGQCQRAENLHF